MLACSSTAAWRRNLTVQQSVGQIHISLDLSWSSTSPDQMAELDGRHRHRPAQPGRKAHETRSTGPQVICHD